MSLLASFTHDAFTQELTTLLLARELGERLGCGDLNVPHATIHIGAGEFPKTQVVFKTETWYHIRHGRGPGTGISDLYR